MNIYYSSKTGNVSRLARKLADLGFVTVPIHQANKVDTNSILITYTASKGQIPLDVDLFLQANSKFIKAVVCSGNMNWGKLYCKCADLILEKYGIPTLLKLELSGTTFDIEKISSFLSSNTL